MDNSFIILTDSCCDMPISYIRGNKIPFVSLSYVLDGKTTKDDFGQKTDYQDFYSDMRKGQMPSTTQVNVYQYTELFKEYLKKGLDIIYIGFSSALSGSFNSAAVAAENIKGEFPDRKIAAIDSLCASMGEGLLLYYAMKMKSEGADFDTIVKWANENKGKLNHWFTVDDLNHLQRGGRLSKAQAIIGSILNIKPILNIDENGKLVAREKIRGRKQALETLVAKAEKYIIEPEKQVVFISHGDCYKEALFVENLLREKLKVKDVNINFVGPVIGAHAGPGTVAIFFFGNSREL